MADKKLQKLFVYSDEKSKTFIDSMLNDISFENGSTTSFIIESILKQAFLPENNYAKNIIYNFLYNADTGVEATLEALFDLNAAGSNFNAKFENYKNFVEFAQKALIDFKIIDDYKKDIPYLLNSLNSIIDKIEKDIDKMDVDDIYSKNQLNWLKKLYEKMENDPESLRAKEFVQIIIDFWEILNNWSYTFRFLCVLTRSCNFLETTENRIELYDLICNLSEEW
jgi:hypothetical protein